MLGKRALGDNLTDRLTGERPGLRVHTIQNDNPYLGLDPTREGNGKYPVIFEPLQNVQMSRSTYKVTSFIDFEPYLRYFTNFERYLNNFLQEIVNFMEDPVFREFRWGSPTAREGDAGIDCSQQPKCEVQLPLFQVRNQNARMEAYRQQRERCVARHFQVCLALRQFDHLFNISSQLYQNFERVKAKFMRAVDYVEETHTHAEFAQEQRDRVKRHVKRGRKSRLTETEIVSIRATLGRLARWEPPGALKNTTSGRKKRFIDILAGIGTILNAGQIKKIKKNIRLLQAQNILQDQKIDELARFLNLTASRVRLHDKQIYNLQARMVRLEEGLEQLTDVTNFHIYASYQINVAQTAVFRLQLGLGAAEANVDKIFEYLRVMTTQRASPAVIPPIALRELLRRVRAKLKPNPRLRLPYDPDTEDIWKYYKVMKITPVVIDKLLVILLTIPIIDSTLELNIYRAHNLPAIPPGHKIATKYLLEGDYFAIGKHGVYAALPSERSIQVCLESDLAICMMQQALYPTMHITWCVYALFVEDEARVQRDCKYEVKPFLDNRAQSLGGYMWAISSIEQEQLQIRCLEETQVIQIRPPLQVVYIGNGCEGYSPSMYIPAKSELSGTEEIESRKEYFLKFNYVYQPDELIGVWWQFRSKLMTIEEAENFVEKVEPLGTMDYSILNRQLGQVDSKYPWSLPMRPMALVVGIGFVLTLLGGVVFAIKLYRVGITVKEAKGIAKTVTTQPLSCFRSILRRSPQGQAAETGPTSQESPGNIGTRASLREDLDLHPIRMRDILQTVLQDERTGIKYGKYLDRQTRRQGSGEHSHPPSQIRELEAPGVTRRDSSS